MRRIVLLPLLLALAWPLAAARAQDPATGPLPVDVVERITRLFNDTTTVLLTGPARISAGSSLLGNVAVLEGSLTVGGRIQGDVAVVNGSLELLDGAEITGAVLVIGGRVTGGERARLGGAVASYAERLDYVRRGERLYAQIDGAEPPPVESEAAAPGEWSRVDGDTAPRQARRGDGGRSDDGWKEPGEIGLVGRSANGRADFVVTTGNGYNRVEGLPITFGPIFETPGSNPFRFRTSGVYRTEAGPAFGPGRWGFEARAEQFFGGHREIRLGATLARAIEPIEEWHLSRLENGLSTFLLHRDFRDHYVREGGTVYLRVDPRSSPVSATLELKLEEHSAVDTGSPLSVFRNEDPWRPQPLAAVGSLKSLSLATRLDTRNEPLEPSTGWYVQGEIEQALHSGLGGATGETVPPDGIPIAAAPFAQPEYGLFTRGVLDVRRYNRINPTSRLNLRLLAAGSLDGETLPPQRQHALGGEGSLPGFGFFALDCGARTQRVTLAPADPSAPRFFPAYGCDGFVLGQVEYRGELSFRLDLRDLLGAREEGGDEDDWGSADGGGGLQADLGWVLFADVGRAWSFDDALRDESTAADVGFGILLRRRLGVYLALPVTGGGDGVNLFVRLSPRF